MIVKCERVFIITALAACLVMLPVLVEAYEAEAGRLSLKGIVGLRPVIVLTQTQDPSFKLEEAMLRSDVLGKLEEARIPILNKAAVVYSAGVPELHYYIGIYQANDEFAAFSIGVNFFQRARLIRDMDQEMPVTTWATASIGVAALPELVEEVRRVVMGLTGEFIHEFRQINPRVEMTVEP